VIPNDHTSAANPKRYLSDGSFRSFSGGLQGTAKFQRRANKARNGRAFQTFQTFQDNVHQNCQLSFQYCHAEIPKQLSLKPMSQVTGRVYPDKMDLND
jgi:hypothetical protein